MKDSFKESLQKFIILLIVVVAVYSVYSRKPRRLRDREISEETRTAVQAKSAKAPFEELAVQATPATKSMATPSEARRIKSLAKTAKRPPETLIFRMEDGVAVVQGDVVVGELVNDDGTETGLVRAPTVGLWASNVIPFFIAQNLREPERVLRALELFSNTVIRFVPFTDQEDVMVFEEGTGVCKSYVGSVGGKQPLWIAPGCQPDDIAHEILHALGFVHEQNRIDRDQFISLFPDNIEEQYQDNFYRLPEELMKVSGLTGFDFESLMIYPVSMFSKNGQPTMQSRIPGQEIQPSRGLSAKDIERVNKAYGGGN
jgi:hypothetical protein